MTDTEALKPCPWCGGEAYVAVEPSRIDNTRVCYGSCLDSECIGFVIQPNVLWQTERQAQTAWNKRAGGAEPVGEVVRCMMCRGPATVEVAEYPGTHKYDADGELIDFSPARKVRRYRHVTHPAPDADLVEALRWYGEQARLCRKFNNEGHAARHALDADGGERAREALRARGIV